MSSERRKGAACTFPWEVLGGRHGHTHTRTRSPFTPKTRAGGTENGEASIRSPRLLGRFAFCGRPGICHGQHGAAAALLLRETLREQPAGQARICTVSRISHDSGLPCGRGISGMARSVPECWARCERNTDADGRLHPMAIYGKAHTRVETASCPRQTAHQLGLTAYQPGEAVEGSGAGPRGPTRSQMGGGLSICASPVRNSGPARPSKWRYARRPKVRSTIALV